MKKSRTMHLSSPLLSCCWAKWQVKTNSHLASLLLFLIYLQFQLVQQWFPVQTEVTFLLWLKSILVEGNDIRPRTLGCDLPIDGQRALIGWDRDPITAWGEVEAQAQALAMVPGATKFQVLIIFTWTWRRQKGDLIFTFPLSVTKLVKIYIQFK